MRFIAPPFAAITVARLGPPEAIGRLGGVGGSFIVDAVLHNDGESIRLVRQHQYPASIYSKS